MSKYFESESQLAIFIANISVKRHVSLSNSDAQWKHNGMAYYNSTTEKQYDTKQPHIFGFREIFHMPQKRVEISLIKINNVNIVRLEWSYR